MEEELPTQRESFKKNLDIDDFVEESKKIIQDYVCPLCHGIYFNPVVDICGHVFCKCCILQHVQSENKCPFSQLPLDENSVKKIEVVTDILVKQIVFCKNRHFYCDWIGKLMDLENHLGYKCHKQTIKCNHDRCPDSTFREDMELHVNQCEFRIVNCQDCHIPIAFIDIKLHQSICPMFKLPCPQKCGSYIERKDIEIHITDDCVDTIVDCPYKDLGCPTRITKRELNDYLTKNMNRHNIMMVKYMKSLTGEVKGRLELIESRPTAEEVIKKIENKFAPAISEFPSRKSSKNGSPLSSNTSPSTKKYEKLTGKKRPRDEEVIDENINKNEEEEKEKFSESLINTEKEKFSESLINTKKDIPEEKHNIDINNILENKTPAEVVVITPTPEDKPVMNNCPSVEHSDNKESSLVRDLKENLVSNYKDHCLIQDVKELKENINSKEKEINEKKASKEATSINSITNSKDLNYFDQFNISKGISLMGSKVICNLNSKSEHKYIFANFLLNSEKDFQFKLTFNLNSQWAAAGICIKEQVISNKLRFVTSSSVSFYNGTFAVSTNGYLWNCNNPGEFNSPITYFPVIMKGDHFIFKYNSESKELFYKIAGKLTGKFSNVYAPKGSSLVPCIILLNPGDEVNFELLQI